MSLCPIVKMPAMGIERTGASTAPSCSRLWFDDAQVIVQGGTVGLLAGFWSGFFFLINLVLACFQLRLFFGRLSQEGKASLKDKT